MNNHNIRFRHISNTSLKFFNQKLILHLQLYKSRLRTSLSSKYIDIYKLFTFKNN